MHLYSFSSRNIGFIGCRKAEDPEGSRRAESFPLDMTLFGLTCLLTMNCTNTYPVPVYAHMHTTYVPVSLPDQKQREPDPLVLRQSKKQRGKANFTAHRRSTCESGAGDGGGACPHLFWKASLSRQGLWLKEEWHSTGMLRRQ